MKVVEAFEIVRQFLGWSYQDVSMKSGKYSPEFLKQVHEGRTFPSVEKDIIVTYIHALAEKAVQSVFRENLSTESFERLIAKFEETIQKWDLSLEDTLVLVERACKTRIPGAHFRTGTLDAVRVEIAWQEVLEAIIDDINGSERQPSFEDRDKNRDDIVNSLLVSVSSQPSHQLDQDSQTLAKATCPNCHETQTEDQGSKCVNCGYQSIGDPNW